MFCLVPSLLFSFPSLLACLLPFFRSFCLSVFLSVFPSLFISFSLSLSLSFPSFFIYFVVLSFCFYVFLSFLLSFFLSLSLSLFSFLPFFLSFLFSPLLRRHAQLHLATEWQGSLPPLLCREHRGDADSIASHAEDRRGPRGAERQSGAPKGDEWKDVAGW